MRQDKIDGFPPLCQACVTDEVKWDIASGIFGDLIARFLEKIPIRIRHKVTGQRNAWRERPSSVVLPQVIVNQHQLALVKGHRGHDLEAVGQ